MKYALTDAHLFDPATGLDCPKGGILIENNKILAVGSDITCDQLGADTPFWSLAKTNTTQETNATEIKPKKLSVIPGLIDLRVHLKEPREEGKETIGTLSRAAVQGGVTTVVGLASDSATIDTIARMEFVAYRARQTKKAKIYTYASLTKGNEGKELTEMGLLSEAGAAGFCEGSGCLEDPKVMMMALRYASLFNKTVFQYPCVKGLASGAMTTGELATRLGLPGISPLSETLALQRDLRLVEETQAPYHAFNITCRESLDLIQVAKKKNLPVTCSTSIHYLLLNEMEVGPYKTFAKVFPPLRSEDDRLALVEAVRTGLIDALTSDHCPENIDSKRLPFESAAFGIIGLETLLPLSLLLHHQHQIPLKHVLGLLTHSPAKILDLDSGRLEKGAPADLALVDLNCFHQIDLSSFKSVSKNSPFDGLPVQGKAFASFVDGRLSYSATSLSPPSFLKSER